MHTGTLPGTFIKTKTWTTTNFSSGWVIGRCLPCSSKVLSAISLATLITASKDTFFHVLNAAQSLNSCWLDSCLNHVHSDNDYQLWTQFFSFPTTTHPNWPLNVLQGLGDQREGFADLTPEVGLGQRQAQVPLSHAPSLDHVGVTVAYCVHDGFFTALDCLQPQLGGVGGGNNCYNHDHQDWVQQYVFFHIVSNFNNYSEDCHF